MLILFLILILAFLPILFFLLSRSTRHKLSVFLIGLVIFGSIYFIYLSPYAITGSVNILKLTHQVKKSISDNKELSYLDLELLLENQDRTNSFFYLTDLVNQAIQDGTLNSAESLIKYLRGAYQEEQATIMIFSLSTDLRDKKNPEYLESTLKVKSILPRQLVTCSEVHLSANLYIRTSAEGILVARLTKVIEHGEEIEFSLNQANRVIKGIDLPAMVLQQETGHLELILECSRESYLAEKNIQFNKLFTHVNISDSEWFKREQ